MGKTNKEFRSDLAKEMRDKFDKRNEDLNQIDRLPISEELKEMNRKAIMDNFYAEIDEMKKRPWYEEAKKTHAEEIKAKVKLEKEESAKEKLLKEYEKALAQVDAKIADRKNSYEEAQIAHRGNVENVEVPEELKNFRRKWEMGIMGIDEDVMDTIIETTKDIKVNVETDSDWSRLIEFKLWDKTRKILDPKLEKYSEGFRPQWDKWYRDSINRIYDYDYVTLNWMKWGDIDNWRNEKLKEYVKMKKNECKWLDIATQEQIKEILLALWEKSGLDREKDQIAMFMYLTWMNWWYWLKNTTDNDLPSVFRCLDDSRWFYRNDAYTNASLCMIACS